MSSFAKKFEDVFTRLLPSPLAIALGLSVIAFMGAYFGGNQLPDAYGARFITTIDIWSQGLWQSSLLAFTVQMMLILVLGHTLALSQPVQRLTQKLSDSIVSKSYPAAWVTTATMMVAFFNWGLGLIFGAILAREVADAARRKQIPISYPLLGAAGYSGLMVWHGGLSGSAPLKAAESGHLTELTQGLSISALPNAIPLEDSVFSTMNISATIGILSLSFILMIILQKWAPTKTPERTEIAVHTDTPLERAKGAQWLDYGRLNSKIWGVILLVVVILLATALNSEGGLSFLTPNYLNTLLLAMAILLHKNLNSFANAVDDAVRGAGGILIQFPLYFGIMALLRDSGLLQSWAEAMVATSSAFSFPIFTLASAAVINVFVPSGGGQWAIQGPIMIEASQALNVPLGKSIMAMAYGDQLTNMLQPFWALPLLAITKLKAREILPYTLILMALGVAVYTITLALF